MADPLSIAASIAGLISLAQGVVLPLVRLTQDVQAFPTEIEAAIKEIQSLCGILCVVQGVVAQAEILAASNRWTREGNLCPDFQFDVIAVIRSNYDLQSTSSRLREDPPKIYLPSVRKHRQVS